MTNVAVIGLGPIGLGAARAINLDPTMHLASIVDINPQLVGKSLGELIGDKAEVGPHVSARLPEGKIEVAVLCTASHFDKVAPQLRELMARRIHVVSSCEEMSFPAYAHPGLAAEIDAEARRQGVAMLGTGVNPGYVMDLLACSLTSMVTEVRAVRCVRRVNASTRRKPLQAKVGATMSVEQFNDLKRQGRIGHMGIAESVAMIAAALGKTASAVRTTLEPVVADRPIESLLGTIKPGQVCGMRNTGHWQDASLTIDLDLTMALGLGEPFDSVDLDGPVPLKLRIEGGTPGDTATVASLVNGARLMPKLAPGLHTMLSIPPATCARG